MTVLVGRNAVGKTNILRAIQWAAGAATSTTAVQADEEVGWVVLEAMLEGTTYRYSLQLRLDAVVISETEQYSQTLIESLEYDAADGSRHLIATRNNDAVIISESETRINIGSSTPFMPAILSLWPENVSWVNVIRRFLSILKGIRYYPFDTSSLDISDDARILSRQRYNDWLTRFRATGEPGNSVLRDSCTYG